ncbi:MAG: L,D-transpeptidase [Bacillota bacterium]
MPVRFTKPAILVSLLVSVALSGHFVMMAASPVVIPVAAPLVMDLPSIPELEPLLVPQQATLEALAGLHGLPLPLPNPKIVIEKSKYMLILYSGDTPVKAYRVGLGASPVGQKEREGDNRTPEGVFYVCQKAGASSLHDPYLGTRWMRLSYPDIEAGRRGLEAGVISRSTFQAIESAIAAGRIPPQHTPLGGGIGIHGGYDLVPAGQRNWTQGCIGMYNADVEELYGQVSLGTPVIIRP